MSISIVLVNTSVVSGLFPLVAALYNYKKLDSALRLMAAFCLVSALLDFTSLITTYFNVHNNLFIMHIFDLTAVIFFTLIYYRAFYTSVLKQFALILGTLSLLGVISYTIFGGGIWSYPSVSNTLLSVLMIVFSLTYFYQLITRQEFMFIEKQGMFWINCGVLLYFSITAFLFMVFNRLSPGAQTEFIMIQSITNIISNLLFSVGLLCKPQITT